MLIELFILLQIVAIGIFFAAFFIKNEVIWALSALMSGILMFSSWGIEYPIYLYNSTLGAYFFTTEITSSYYMMGINLAFFALTIVFGLYDLFTKYTLEGDDDSINVQA